MTSYFAAISLFFRSLGQVLSAIQAKFRGQQWKQRQLKKITDTVFDHLKDDSHKEHLPFEDLYNAVLFAYKQSLPGPHIDPPSKARVKALMESYDVNLDGRLNREQFEGFIEELSKEALTIIRGNVILALIVVPTVALVTKRATEGGSRSGEGGSEDSQFNICIDHYPWSSHAAKFRHRI